MIITNAYKMQQMQHTLHRQSLCVTGESMTWIGSLFQSYMNNWFTEVPDAKGEP